MCQGRPGNFMKMMTFQVPDTFKGTCSDSVTTLQGSTKDRVEEI